MVIEIGWRLLTKADMERFEQMLESMKIGRLLIGRGMGTSVLRMG